MCSYVLGHLRGDERRSLLPQGNGLASVHGGNGLAVLAAHRDGVAGAVVVCSGSLRPHSLPFLMTVNTGSSIRPDIEHVGI